MAEGPGSSEKIGVARNISRNRLLRWGLLATALLALLAIGIHYWRDSQRFASTDNAYVNADRVDIAAQVNGPVTALRVGENQAVKAGDLLFEIDEHPFRIALDKAEAQLRLAGQGASQQDAAVAAAQAQVAQREAELNNARHNYQRFRDLMERGFYSQQGGETARTQVDTAAAALKAAQANVEQARSALGQSGPQNANVRAAAAAVEQAKLDLQHTHVSAPADGTIVNLTLRPGDMVQAGVPLFVLIGSRSFWVDANFKETELKRIRNGQTATIEVDMYPQHAFHGVVDSVSGGSGTAFSLLPPQNATGNWVKVTQRVPVRVRVTDPDPRYPLRVGTSATVRVEVAPG